MAWTVVTDAFAVWGVRGRETTYHSLRDELALAVLVDEEPLGRRAALIVVRAGPPPGVAVAVQVDVADVLVLGEEQPLAVRQPVQLADSALIQRTLVLVLVLDALREAASHVHDGTPAVGERGQHHALGLANRKDVVQRLAGVVHEVEVEQVARDGGEGAGRTL